MVLRSLFLDLQRRRMLHRAATGPMREYYSVPFPGGGNHLGQTRFVAVDLETTGLNASRDDILSIGMVFLHYDRIDLGSARHRFLAPGRDIPESSAIIHQITDDSAATGSSPAQIIPQVLAALAGHVMVAHHAAMERSFLDAACRKLYGFGLVVPVIDTEVLFRRQLDRRGQVYRGAGLRLHALRERFGLPRYRAHDALTDALAVAELFLAFLAHAQITPDQPLRRVLTG